MNIAINNSVSLLTRTREVLFFAAVSAFPDPVVELSILSCLGDNGVPRASGNSAYVGFRGRITCENVDNLGWFHLLQASPCLQGGFGTPETSHIEKNIIVMFRRRAGSELSIDKISEFFQC